ncbi:MAG: arginine--tRNA ligase, partial [Candidatus Omnitrophica bacterium]|nr:arginine--tRNA ligase [Candidatus Omnitrophota bacterium]
LGESIRYHYLHEFGIDVPFPEDGYRGAYIKDIALQVKAKYGDRYAKADQDNRMFFSQSGVEAILGIIKDDLETFGVRFDSWFSQRVLTREKILSVLAMLREKGYVFDLDGAVWFKSTAFGDDKDRVVTKSDGSFTYFAPDIAYHLDKYTRKYDKVINIWGPDHHGYIPRLTAAIQALGFDKASLAVLIVQLATLYRNGEVVRMSTRAGEFITLKEVMDEVGKDVTRFFFLMRKLDSHLDFDLEVAKKQSTDNPVYYIQYAHARIWSIKDHSLKAAKELGPVTLDLALLREKEEEDLMRLLAQLPAYIRDSAVTLEPYYIILYLNELAALFHNFYTKHKVVTEDLSLTKARLYLVDCVRICLANGLRLLGVSLPKKM